MIRKPTRLPKGAIVASNSKDGGARAGRLEKAAQEILQELESEFPREIPSHVIGAKVMDKLHQFDEVAYVRYASVYRHFQDIGEFLEEIQSLERRPKRSTQQPELFK